MSTWLLGGVVAPDAYERVVNRLRTEASEDRLAKEIRAEVGRYPRRVFWRWYRTQETWEALVRGGQESLDDLVSRLVEVSHHRLLGGPLSLERAQAIVRAAATSFMSSLEPSEAVDVADYRSAQRDRLIDVNAEQRKVALEEHIDERFDVVEGQLEGVASFDERVAALPALARPFFEAVGPSRETLLALDFVSAAEPREALVQLTADIPSWLRDSPGGTLVAVAEMCRVHRVHLGAGHLFELSAERSPERAYFYARAAAEFASADESDRSADLIARATSLSTSPAVTAIAAALGEDPARALESLSIDQALEDPYLVLVRLYGLRHSSALADIISFLRTALARYPESTGMMIELAWSYLQRSQEPGTTSS